MKKFLTCVTAIAVILSASMTACKPQPKKENDGDDFACWSEGINYSAAVDDNYVCEYSDNKKYIGADVEAGMKSEGTEAHFGNKYYRVEKEYTVDGGNEALDRSRTVAVKEVNENGKNRTKKFELQKNGDGETNKRGSYVNPTTAKDCVQNSPEQMLYGYGFENAEDFDGAVAGFTEWWYGDSTERTDKLTASIKKNADGSVSAIFKGEYTYTRRGFDGEFKGDCAVTIEFAVKDGKFVKYKEISNGEYKLESDPTKNYTETDTREYTFEYGAFDEDFYNSIDVTTEETYDEYCANVNFYIEGYLYPVTMRLPVGESADAEDVKAALVDWDENQTFNTLIGSQDQEKNERFMNALTVYTDAAMSKPLESITAEEYSDEAPQYNLYIKITPPKDAAWVISYVESNNIKGLYVIRRIQGAMNNNDGTFTFNAGSRLDDYPVIKADGEDPSADGKYVFEGGSLHIFYCENKY